MRVSVNIIRNNPHSVQTCKAMAAGIVRNGDTAVIRSDRDNVMNGFDACVLWGYIPTCQQAIKNCQALNIPWVFIDMGYWRRDKNYFKVAVNDRHPTPYLLDRELPSDRFDSLGLEIKDWKFNNSGAILVAGMSAKAAWSWKLGTEQYERETITELRNLYPGFPIIYRPKPSFMNASKFYGTKYDRTTPLHKLWADTFCVVAHHSNVCCEALLEGIPTFAKYGAASVLGTYDLKTLRKPRNPDRTKWARNLAYSQWNMFEMTNGACWAHLKDVGLIK